MGIANGVRGRARFRLLQLHRLVEFERVFTLYVEGKASAVFVTDKAKKMLAVHSPRLK